VDFTIHVVLHHDVTPLDLTHLAILVPTPNTVFQFSLAILQKLLLQPQCSIFVYLLSNNLPVHKKLYGHEKMERSLEI
jgi:hypothetical protein